MDERLKDAYVRGPNPQSLEAEGLAYNLRQTAKNSREYTAGLEQDLAQARKEAAKTAELIETYEAEGRELDMFAPECDLLLGPGNYDPSPFLVEQGVELQSDLVNADETITQLNGVISEAEELPEAAQKELEYLDNAKEAREEVRTSRKAAVEAHDNYLETHESYLEQIPVIQEEQMALYDTTECF